MICVYCLQEWIPSFTWKHLIGGEEVPTTCETCQSLFHIIDGTICDKCGRPSEDKRCRDCERWKDSAGFCYNRSLFRYNEGMKEWLHRYKFRGDVALLQMFQEQWQKGFDVFSSKIDVIVPVPLSEERLYERSFNQAALLADLLPLEKKMVLGRWHSEKQSKKSRQQRLQRENVFYISEQVNGARILVVDDLYTTGVTLHQCAEVLAKAGAKEIYSYTLAR